MKAPDRTDVIHGDEQCRDGQYRPKQGLREKTAASNGTAELDPAAPLSLQAQNAFTLGDLWIGSASESAAGIPAIWNTMLYGIGDRSPV
ncbi:MAG: hypothetical protein WBX22_15430 [Silvibacterium sp.]